MDAKSWRIRKLFSGAPREYDSLLSLLTLTFDSKWRKAVVAASPLPEEASVLDVATGTGLTASNFSDKLDGRGMVVGIDFCEPMLRKGRENLKSDGKQFVQLVAGRAESLPFADESFHCATITLALRNVTNSRTTFEEMARVVKYGGAVISLDFSRPSSRLFRKIYYFYIFRVLPLIGRLVSREWQDIFNYLCRSIEMSLAPAKIAELMESVGLCRVKVNLMSRGIVTLVVGIKPREAYS